MNSDSILWRFVQNEIAIPQKDREQAIRSREWVIDKVIAKIDECDDAPRLYSEKNKLYFGSYFKGTKLSSEYVNIDFAFFEIS
jgi:hypothetical protein